MTNRSPEEQRDFDKRLMRSMDENPMDPNLHIHLDLEITNFPNIHHGWYDLQFEINKTENKEDEKN